MNGVEESKSNKRGAPNGIYRWFSSLPKDEELSNILDWIVKARRANNREVS